MSKTIKAEKMHYTNAYFGWVKFTLDPEKLELIEKDIKAFDPMLRYIIVKTVTENTMVTEGIKAIGADREESKDEEEVKENDILVDETPKEKEVINQ